MRKGLLIGAICFLFSSLALSKENETYIVNGKSQSKREAIKALLLQPDTEVYRCQLVHLTDKVTLKKKSSKSE